MRRLLVLRPEPGATATVRRAEALGLQAVAAPLFRIEPVAWEPPAGDFDALMITSANAVRHGGAGLAAYRGLPAYAVGGATAAALRDAGFETIRVGDGDAADLLAMMAEDGVRSALHLGGEVIRAVDDPRISMVRVPVYRAVAVEGLAIDPRDSVAVLHSPRAAALFASLAEDRSRIAIAAISAAAAAAAGEGWRQVAVAERPTDDALLAVAAPLCEE